MPPIDPLSLYLLYALGVGQLALLITNLVQQAGIRERVVDHHRRISDLERRSK